jgi:hypothetical protein
MLSGAGGRENTLEVPTYPDLDRRGCGGNRRLGRDRSRHLPAARRKRTMVHGQPIMTRHWHRKKWPTTSSA